LGFSHLLGRCWFHVLDQVEEEYDDAGSPADMMLCRAETAVETTIFIGMLLVDMLEGYDDFERCSPPGGVNGFGFLWLTSRPSMGCAVTKPDAAGVMVGPGLARGADERHGGPDEQRRRRAEAWRDGSPEAMAAVVSGRVAGRDRDGRLRWRTGMPCWPIRPLGG
jgi:hypothetical protein